MKKFLPLLLLALLLVPTASVFAAPSTDGIVALPKADVQNTGGIIEYICVIFGYLFTGLILAAVLFVILAAYRYLTAAGDPGKVSAANKTLIYAAVAIAVALFARAIPVIVGNFVLSGSSTSGDGFDVCSNQG